MMSRNEEDEFTGKSSREQEIGLKVKQNAKAYAVVGTF